MGRIKEYYHDQINEGIAATPAEPYMFKYVAHFNYMGESFTLFADTHKRILELAKGIVPEINGVRMSVQPNQFEFTTPHMNLPFLVFECVNPRY
jgi:hypothetical protein